VSLQLPALRYLSFNTRHGPFVDVDARRAGQRAPRPAGARVYGRRRADRPVSPACAHGGRDGPSPVPGRRARRRPGEEALGRPHRSPRAPHVQVAAVRRTDRRPAAELLRSSASRSSSGRSATSTPSRSATPTCASRTGARRVRPVEPARPAGLSRGSSLRSDPTLNAFGNHNERLQLDAEAAQRLSGDRRRDAYAALAQDALRTWAPWAVFSQVAQPAFFSARLGCISSSPGVLRHRHRPALHPRRVSATV
jgi:hypothetical protein